MKSFFRLSFVIFPLLFFLSVKPATWGQTRPVIELEVGTVEGAPGDTVCIPVRVKHLHRATRARLALRTLDLGGELVSVQYHPQLFEMGEADLFAFSIRSDLWEFYFERLPGEELSLPDGSILFEFCVVIGQFHEATSFNYGTLVYITDALIFDSEILVVNERGNPQAATLHLIGGNVNITTREEKMVLDLELNSVFDCGVELLTVGARPEGGTAPYTYIYGTYPGGTPAFRLSTSDSVLQVGEDPLTHGTYQVVVEDAAGQVAISHFYYYGGNDGLNAGVNGLSIPRVDAQVTPPGCNQGVRTGSIRLNQASGFDADLTYAWNTGAQTNFTDNLEPGLYTVTITDKESGCEISRQFDLIPQGNFSMEAQNGSVFCVTDTTEVGFPNQEDYPDIQFQWETGDTTALVVLPSGDYEVTLTDQFCEEVRQVSVSHEREFVGLDESRFRKISEPYTCLDSMARIGVTQLDASRQYAFSWSHDPTLQDSVLELSGLTGEVHLTITAPGECPMRIFFTLTEPRFDFFVSRLQDYTSCIEDNYSLGFRLIGQVADSTQLSFNWSSGDTTRLVTLPAGPSYTGTIIYGEYCEETYQFNTGFRPQLQVDLQRDTFGCQENSATIGVLDSAAYPGRTYQWQTGDTTAFLTVQEPGNYTVRIQEGGCTSFYSMAVPRIINPRPLDTALFRKIEGPALGCDAATGIIGVEARQDTGNYTYSWRRDESLKEPVLEVASPGYYILRIDDGLGCPYETGFLVEEAVVPDSLFPFTPTARLNCSTSLVDLGLVFTESVDSTPYQYLWRHGDSTRLIEANLFEWYYLDVQYGESPYCKRSYTLDTYVEPDFDLDLKQDTQRCEEIPATIGVLNSEVYPGMSYRWSNGDTTALTMVNNGNHRLTLTDGFCTQTVSFFVPFRYDDNGLSEEEFEIVQTALTCAEPSATIGLRQLDGQKDYNFIWLHEEFLEDSLIEVNQPGQYILEVIGEGTCPRRVTFDLVAPDRGPIAEKVQLYRGCELDRYQLGASLPDTLNLNYTWSTGAKTPQIEVPAGEVYYLTLTNGSGDLCRQELTFNAESQRPRARLVRNDCTAQNACDANVRIWLDTDFVEGPLRYTWSDGTERTVFQSGVTFNFPSQAERLDVYVQDEGTGCRDTIRDIPLICIPEEVVIRDKYIVQYVECQADTLSGDQQAAVVYTEVFSNFSTVPPYTFEWTNGQTETSYYRSAQALSDLEIIGARVVDQVGGTFDKGFGGEAVNYGCGNLQSPSFLAAEMIVGPDHSFRYPIYLKNYEGLESAIFTVNWDPCLINADSIITYDSGGTAYPYAGEFLLNGIWEFGFQRSVDLPEADSVLLGEVYFTASDTQTGISPFLFALNEPPVFAEANENNGIIPIHGSITVADPADLVTPGDTDKDGAVGHKDILNIGLGYAAQGPDRRSVDVSRQAFGYSWREDLPRSQTNYKNIDCDGDGSISQTDIAAIHQNWDYDQPLTPEEITFGAPELFIRRDTLMASEAYRVPVELGLFFDAVDRIHGIAFSVAYDPAVIDEQSLAFEWEESWLIEDEAALSLIRIDTQQHLMRIALTNTDKMNRAGYGPIGHLNFTVKEGIEEVTFEFGDILAVDAQEQISPVNGSTSTLFIRTISTNTERIALALEIRLYPQPVSDWLYLDYPEGRLQAYSIRDLSGKTILGAKSIERRINLSGLPQGMYLLQLRTDSGLITKKLIKASR